MAASSIEAAVLALMVIGVAGSAGSGLTSGIPALATAISAAAGGTSEPAGPTAEELWIERIEAINNPTDCSTELGAYWGGWPSSGGSGCVADEFPG